MDRPVTCFCTEEQESKTLLGNGYSSYMVTIVVAGVFTYLVKGQDHGIQIVGHLDKGLNPCPSTI
ncbi:hypothetical protein AAZX31_20G035300 [Glycine max]